MNKRELYLNRIREVNDILDGLYENGRLKPEHLNSVDAIDSMVRSVSPVIESIERNKEEIDFDLSYKEIYEKRYGTKALPYRLTRRYNDIDFLVPVDLMFAVIDKFNPNKEEELTIDGETYVTKDLLKDLIDWVEDYLEMDAYDLLGEYSSFEAVEDLMRGSDWISFANNF